MQFYSKDIIETQSLLSEWNDYAAAKYNYTAQYM